jgi:hypothetical protein
LRDVFGTRPEGIEAARLGTGQHDGQVGAAAAIGGEVGDACCPALWRAARGGTSSAGPTSTRAARPAGRRVRGALDHAVLERAVETPARSATSASSALR